MRVIVTRPAQEAQRWVDRLRARAHEALALPLIDIVPAPDPQPLQLARQAIAHYAAVMFVSANAVQGFLVPDGAWPTGGARAWAPGPATRDALLAAGVPATQVDAPAPDAAQFDSESLWQQVRDQLRTGDRLLLVRGAGNEGVAAGREWLSQQLSARGVQVDTVVAYARQLPAWGPAEAAAAQAAAADGSVWLFSSSEAAQNLKQLLPTQAWHGAIALATHPRIAQTLRALGFGRVDECRPGFAEVLASIESAR